MPRPQALRQRYGRYSNEACRTNTGIYRGLLMNEMIAKIRKTTKQTFAIQAAVPAIPPKPRKAAMSAMTRKTMA